MVEAQALIKRIKKDRGIGESRQASITDLPRIKGKVKRRPKGE